MLTLLFTVAMAQDPLPPQLYELPVLACVKADGDTDLYRVILEYSFGEGGAPQSVAARDGDGKRLRAIAKCINRAFLELEPLGDAVANKSYETSVGIGRPLDPSSPVGRAPFLPIQQEDSVLLMLGLSAEEAEAMAPVCDEPPCMVRLGPQVELHYPGPLGHTGTAATLMISVPTGT